MTASEPRLTRRGLLGFGAVGGAALAGGVVGGLAVGRTSSASAATAAAEPFHGAHQSGIATSAQDRLVFATFDVISTDRDELARMLRTWTAAAEAMAAGEPVPGPSGVLLAPPADTGEAAGLAPARLTVTVGFGPTLFDDRFGLQSAPACSRWLRCPRCPATCSRRHGRAATSRSRPAPTTPRSPSTPSATWRGWAAGSS